MIRRRLLAIPVVALAWTLAGAGGAAQAAPQSRIQIPPVTRATLPNGMRVLLMEYHRAPTVVVAASFPGGTVVDPPGKAGTVGTMAALLRRGTRTRTAEQIAEAIDFLGGALDSAAGDDRIAVSVDVLSQYLDTGLDLMADVLRNPTFPEEELSRERELSLAALAALSEDPGAVADRVAQETVYAGHPYGVDETMRSVRAITRDDIVDAYHRVVAPERAVVVAVGDFKAADMLARLRARFGDWPRAGTPAPAVPPVPASTPRIVLIDKPDATQTQVRLVRTGLPRRTPLHFPASVANAILGGGFTSRLTEQIRVNRSLTYGIGSGFSEHLRGGDFTISTFTKVETTRAMLDATNALLRQTAATGFTPREMSRVKGYISGLFAIGVQTPERMADELGDMAFYGLPDDYLATYLQRVQGVTLTQADQVARTFCPPQGFSLVLVGPAARVTPQLKGLGRIETRPVESVGQ